MSATRRKKAVDGETTTRETPDHYATPVWCSKVIVERIGFDLRGKRVLECAAGDGAMVNVLADAGATVDAIEIDQGRSDQIRGADRAQHVWTGDFLSERTVSRTADADQWDVVISNPPYGEAIPVLDPNGKPMRGTKGKPITKYRDLALEFAQKAMTLAPVVAFLLRLNWAGSISRHAFHTRHPADLVVLVNRPKFRIGSGGDATEYAWWIWRRGATIGTWSTHFSHDAPSRGRPKGITVPPRPSFARLNGSSTIIEKSALPASAETGP